MAFDGLVSVRYAAGIYLVIFPTFFTKVSFQDVGHIDLHPDVIKKILGVQVPVGILGKAINTMMATASVAVKVPVGGE
jgi:hypothetical protein